MLKISATYTPTASLSKEAAKAAALAIKRTAWDVRSAIMQAMQTSFDRPTPFTMRAWRVDAAGLDATVWAMPLQAKYLAHQVEGGERETKAFEHKLRLFGEQVAVPASGARLNQYGNMSQSFIGKVLQGGGQYFAGKPRNNGLPNGVWQRKGGKLLPVMTFADDAQYKGRLNLAEIAQQQAGKTFESHLIGALFRS